MSQPGMSVMIRQLFGTTNKKAIDPAELKGQIIKSIELNETADPNELKITFLDGGILTLSDQGQSCCELRYMRTDDNVKDFEDSELLGIALENAPDPVKGEDDYGDHEIQFLRISTSKGVLVLSNHNEHNGYYGGFALEASYQPAKKAENAN